ncbi:MAG: hypothetical protein AMJ81_10755 [Phycisphaerae bacterium SM23_33]|nr:MAG: hypothetical protein AMJ81_10755 [Phycisphaerae bacterium SM23_33]
MTLYTRTGDKGFTLLPAADGKTYLRVRKDDVRVEALGAIDELNAAVGFAAVEAARLKNHRIQHSLLNAQDGLFRVGAMLAAIAAGAQPKVRLDNRAVTRMEKQIDGIWAELGELKRFVFVGGCELAGRLHLARTVARRAERAVVTVLNASQEAKRSRSTAAAVARYLNRLSDLLFALARKATRDGNVRESTGKP